MRVKAGKFFLFELIDEMDASRSRQKIRNSIFHKPEGDGFLKVYDKFEKQFISNVITAEKVRKFEKGDGYLISSQTGSGKTTLIVEECIPIAREREKKILIIVPRKALAMQYKMQIAGKYEPEILRHYTHEGIEKLVTIGSADIVLMQSINQESIRKFLREQQKNYEFIVFDEVHAFVNDANFNRFTEMSFSFLTNIGKEVIRLYLSATPESVLDVLVESEKKLSEKSTKNGILNTFKLDNYQKGKFSFLRFKMDYSYIIPVFFKKQDELILHLKSLKNQKTLIFVQSKSQGEKLKECLEDSVFIDAESKESKEKDSFQQILDKHEFSQQFLIVTKFLDVGVDLKDLKIKNIVTFSPYREEVLQMIGRRRISGEETITAYFYVPTYEEIRKKIGKLKLEYEKMKSASEKIYSTCIELPAPYYIYAETGKININYNTFSFLANTFYQKMLLEYVGDFKENSREYEWHYTDIVLSWLPKHQQPHWLNEEVDKGLEKILEQYLYIDLTEEMCIELGKKIFDYTGTTRRKSQEENIPTQMVNRIFKKLKQPYILQGLSKEKKKKMWRLEKGWC